MNNREFLTLLQNSHVQPQGYNTGIVIPMSQMGSCGKKKMNCLKLSSKSVIHSDNMLFVIQSLFKLIY